MPTPSTGQIRFTDLVTYINGGNSLGGYRGKVLDNSGAAFAISAGSPISFSQLRGKSGISLNGNGFTNGYKGFSATTLGAVQSFTVPVYTTINIDIRGGAGGGGGGGGGTGADACASGDGSKGGDGTPSTFGNQGDAWYLVATGGKGGGGGGGSGSSTVGATGADGTGNTTNTDWPLSAPGGAANGKGKAGGASGKGGKSIITLTNPVIGGTGPVSGSTIQFVLGMGGAAGAGGNGANATVVNGYLVCVGDSGRNGYSGTAGNNSAMGITIYA